MIEGRFQSTTLKNMLRLIRAVSSLAVDRIFRVSSSSSRAFTASEKMSKTAGDVMEAATSAVESVLVAVESVTVGGGKVVTLVESGRCPSCASEKASVPDIVHLK